jgi:hypothetical protein
MEEEGKYHPDNMLPDGTRDENLKEIFIPSFPIGQDRKKLLP